MAQWDDHVLWEGEQQRRRGRSGARYRLTRDALHLEHPGDPPRRDLIPLGLIVGATVVRSVPNRMRGLADVRLDLDREVRVLAPIATLEAIEDAADVSTLILEHADRVRRVATMVEYADPSVAPSALKTPDERARHDLPLVQQLRELGALHDAGVLTDDEFASLKAKLIAD